MSSGTRKARRLRILAFLDGLGVVATSTAFGLSLSSPEPLLPLLTGGIAIANMVATTWWWRKTRKLV